METDNFKPSSYLAPRYWPTWIGLGILRLLVLLPYSLQVSLGKGIGRLFYRLVGSRRRVARINVELCFPELDEPQREALVRESFESTGVALFEAALAWWGGRERLSKLYRLEGMEHFRTAEAQGKGVILLGGHYTTIEISGPFFTLNMEGVQPIYKKAKNPLFNAFMTKVRKQVYDDILPNSDLRTVIRRLKQGKVIWYAPDQDFGRERSVFAPFMGVATATLTTTARLAKVSGAPVVPYYSERLPDNQGYLIRMLPALKNFPSGDDVADATQVNQAIEELVRKIPAQYLWVHKRFKTRPEGEPDLYRRK